MEDKELLLKYQNKCLAETLQSLKQDKEKLKAEVDKFKASRGAVKRGLNQFLSLWSILHEGFHRALSRYSPKAAETKSKKVPLPNFPVFIKTFLIEEEKDQLVEFAAVQDDFKKAFSSTIEIVESYVEREEETEEVPLLHGGGCTDLEKKIVELSLTCDSLRQTLEEKQNEIEELSSLKFQNESLKNSIRKRDFELEHKIGAKGNENRGHQQLPDNFREPPQPVPIQSPGISNFEKDRDQDKEKKYISYLEQKCSDLDKKVIDLKSEHTVACAKLRILNASQTSPETKVERPIQGEDPVDPMAPVTPGLTHKNELDFLQQSLFNQMLDLRKTNEDLLAQKVLLETRIKSVTEEKDGAVKDLEAYCKDRTELKMLKDLLNNLKRSLNSQFLTVGSRLDLREIENYLKLIWEKLSVVFSKESEKYADLVAKNNQLRMKNEELLKERANLNSKLNNLVEVKKLETEAIEIGLIYKSSLDGTMQELRGLNSELFAENKLWQEKIAALEELQKALEGKVEEKLVEVNTLETEKNYLRASLLSLRDESLQMAKENTKLHRELILSKNGGVNVNGAESLKTRQELESLLEREALLNLKRKLLCDICNLSYKEKCITNCMHSFCSNCLEINVGARNRKCPLCQTKFSEKEIKRLWFLSENS